MKRLLCLPLLWAVVLAAPGAALAQTRPAPFYSLPSDGTWVEYEWVQVPPEGSPIRSFASR